MLTVSGKAGTAQLTHPGESGYLRCVRIRAVWIRLLEVVAAAHAISELGGGGDPAGVIVLICASG